MKLSELMNGHTPEPSFAGFATANDMVLAVDFTGKADDPNEYTVAQEGVKEQQGSLSAQTQETEYLRTGKVTVKTSTSRSFSVNGDRYLSDKFQDELLKHSMKYGTGQEIIKPYVYFNMLTGVGEKGEVSIIIEDDAAGGAGSAVSFTAKLTSTKTPAEYTYAPARAAARTTTPSSSSG